MTDLIKDQRNLITVTGFIMEITPDSTENKEVTGMVQSLARNGEVLTLNTGFYHVPPEVPWTSDATDAADAAADAETCCSP